MASPENQETIASQLPTAAGATLGLWFILLAFGGGCLAWYYSSIEYFPDIAWEEALSFLGVLSIIGGSLTVAFGLLAFFPGVIWSEVLLSDCQLWSPLRYWRADDKQEACLLSIAKTIGLPFALFIFTMHLLIALSGRGSATPDGRITAIIAIGSLVILLLTTELFMWRIRAALKKWGKRQHPNQHSSPSPPTEECASGRWRASAATTDPHQSSRAKYRAAFMTSALLCLVSLLILERLLGFDQLGAFFLAIFCAAVTVAANIFVAMLFGTQRLRAILVAGLATILLLVVGEWVEGPHSLLHRVMKSYGIGEGTRYVLIVTKEGSDLLEEQGLRVQVGAKGALGKISDIAILSRLGENFFLCSGQERVSLPKWMVVSWSALPSGNLQVCHLRPAPP